MQEKKLKIWHLSDSHGFHNQYSIPSEGVDIAIHTGDACNDRSPYLGENEFYDFIYWYGTLGIKYPIYVAGNHDAFIAKNTRIARREMENLGIIYLEDEEIVIDGIKIYGTPWTPEFGAWHFMKDRSKMSKTWDQVPEDVNILATHGPPKGLLDTSDFRQGGRWDLCGDSSIHKYFDNWKDLKYLCCGHIHNKTKAHVFNTGIKEHKHFKVVNSAGVEDGRFDYGLVYNGTLIEI